MAPTPTPEATPTPEITPPLTVRIGPEGTYTVARNTYLVIYVHTLAGAACRLTSAPSHPSLDMGMAPASGLLVAQWGRDATPGSKPWWPVGSYTITATCTRDGETVSADRVVHILAPQPTPES